MSNIKQSPWPWDKDKHTWLCCWRGQGPAAVHWGKLALQGGRGGCPHFPHSPEHPPERGWRSSSALPLPTGEQQHPDHSNTAACCSCSSLEGLGRGFQKQPRLKHHPCTHRAEKPHRAAPDTGWSLCLGSTFLLEGRAGMAGEFKLCVALQGPGVGDGKTQLGRKAEHD